MAERAREAERAESPRARMEPRYRPRSAREAASAAIEPFARKRPKAPRSLPYA